MSLVCNARIVSNSPNPQAPVGQSPNSDLKIFQNIPAPFGTGGHLSSEAPCKQFKKPASLAAKAPETTQTTGRSGQYRKRNGGRGPLRQAINYPPSYGSRAYPAQCFTESFALPWEHPRKPGWMPNGCGWRRGCWPRSAQPNASRPS